MDSRRREAWTGALALLAALVGWGLVVYGSAYALGVVR